MSNQDMRLTVLNEARTKLEQGDLPPAEREKLLNLLNILIVSLEKYTSPETWQTEARSLAQQIVSSQALLTMLEQQAVELDALKKFSLNLTSSLDLPAVLDAVVHEAMRLVAGARTAHISHKLPLVRGFLMYLTAVVQTILLNHKPAHMRIQADEQDWEQSVLMLTLCNGPREGGGFIIAPEAKNNDGVLHYAMVGKVSRLTMFRLVPEFMRGTHGRFSQVRLGACRRLILSADRPLYIHADGEIYTAFGSNLRQLRLEVLPAALEVICG